MIAKRKKENSKTMSNTLDYIGYDLLGPVTHQWLLNLHNQICHLDDGNTAFLMCARAGVRIENLYKIYKEGLNGAHIVKTDMFWVSRISVAKGLYNRDRTRAVKVISDEYKHNPISEIVRGLLRHHPDRLADVDLSTDDMNAHGFNFSGWITGNSIAQRSVRNYLENCAIAFESYISDALTARKKAVLIDSGWGATMQSLLSSGFPEISWKGLYFGRSFLPHHDKSIAFDAVGLMFERDSYDPDVPESAFVRHRHLIECLLEPNAPSIEEIPAQPFSEVTQKMIMSNLNEIIDSENDAIYLSVQRYIYDNAHLPMAEIISRHQLAIRELERIIINPTRDEAISLRLKNRSADFGKDLSLPVLIDPPHDKPEEKDFRIQKSLWPEGQIALEYGGEISRHMQMRLNNISTNASHFDPNASAGSYGNDLRYSLPSLEHPKVAIITRTKNRPLLLQRAARSVAAQSFQDFIWVVVNDGGDDSVVREVIDGAPIDRRRIILGSNPSSQGMEAASNAGIKASKSDYIVIHDDDDSWHPDFLQKSVKFLESAQGKRYGGVITKSIYVSEEIRGDTVVEHGRYPYRDWVRNVNISEMACGNFFPPISFLFRREIWDNVGGYNEDLPVLGDWFFNMEFLLRADIGVIDEQLAFYHHRDRGDSQSGIYSNSVIGGRSKHEEFSAVAHNAFLRRYANTTSAALSVVIGYSMNAFRNRGIEMGRDNNSEDDLVEYGNKKLELISEKYDLQWIRAEINRELAIRLASKDKRRKQDASRILDSLSDGDFGWSVAADVLRAISHQIPTPDDFDESSYLKINGDVAEAVRNGEQSSGYMHYILYGRVEGRSRPHAKEISPT